MMSEKQLLSEEEWRRGSAGEFISEPDSDSDWLSDTASRTRSPFQEEGDAQSDSKLGFRGILSKVRKSSGSGRGSAGSVKGEDYKVYRWRWLMLATLSLLNLSNGMVGAQKGAAIHRCYVLLVFVDVVDLCPHTQLHGSAVRCQFESSGLALSVLLCRVSTDRVCGHCNTGHFWPACFSKCRSCIVLIQA